MFRNAATAGSPSATARAAGLVQRQILRSTTKAARRYQIIVEIMQPAGEAVAAAEYEQQAKLQTEGVLFVCNHRKSLPSCALRWCDHLKTGAALR